MMSWRMWSHAPPPPHRLGPRVAAADCAPVPRSGSSYRREAPSPCRAYSGTGRRCRGSFPQRTVRLRACSRQVQSGDSPSAVDALPRRSASSG